VDAQAEVDSLQQRGVAQARVLDVLSRSRASRVVAVIDACFSGRAPSGKPLVARLQPIVVEAVPKTEDRLTLLTAAAASDYAGPRFPLLTAAAASEYAGPVRGLERPAFSYLVLGGLRGWADADLDGSVTAGELRAYATRALSLLATDRVQRPTLRGAAGVVLG